MVNRITNYYTVGKIWQISSYKKFGKWIDPARKTEKVQLIF